MGKEDFRIELERTGGFAGTATRRSLDSSALEARDARDLAALLDRVDLGAVTVRASGRSGEDYFKYRLTVDRGGERMEVTFGESDVPAELRPLLDRLL